jgi:hypothetical protein
MPAARRDPRPGPEKAAFDAWYRDGAGEALRILARAGINLRDRAEFLRNVIGVPEAHIASCLASGQRPATGGSAPRHQHS